MKIKNILLVIGASISLIFCRTDERISSPKFLLNSQNIEADFNKTVQLSPNIPVSTVSYKWLVDGKLVSTDKFYNFTTDKAGLYKIKFVAINNAGADTLFYKVQVFGQFAEGVLVLNSKTDNSGGDFSLIKNDIVTQNVYKSVNNKRLGNHVVSVNMYNNMAYTVAQSGGEYLTMLDPETLEFQKAITASTASNPSYVNFFNYSPFVTNSKSSDRNIYAADFTANTITNKIAGLSDVPAIQNNIYETLSSVLIIDGKTVKQYNPGTKTFSNFKTYSSFVSGILKGNANDFWIAVQKDTEPAIFEHYKNDLSFVESVQMPSTIKLSRNGNISNTGTSVYYWQETSTGDIYQFDINTKTAGKFASPKTNGAAFVTNAKAHPVTQDVYVSGVENFSTGKGIVFVYNKAGNLLKTYNNIGNNPMDFIFNYKELFRGN